MDSQDNNKHPEGCRCHMCMMQKCGDKMCHGGCCRHGVLYCILRWVLAFILLSIVFNVGMKIGEFKSMLQGGYGHGYHSQSQYDPSYGGGYGMMNNTSSY